MHILYVWSYWQYPQVALEFVERLSRRGHQVSVLLSNSENVENIPNQAGIDFHFVPKLDVFSVFTGTPYPVFLGASSYIEAIDPDIVHVNSHLFLTSYQALRSSVPLGIPSVLTVHGFAARRGRVVNALQFVYLRTVAKSIFRRATRVLCLTEGDAASVAGLIGGFNKVSVVPNGVDTNLFRPSPKKDDNLIAWVGRLVPEKGLIYLLTAMKEVIAENREARLVLIGDGILKDRLIRLSYKLRIRDRVDFLGKVDRAQVADILSKSSVFAFPSIVEGMPFSLLEALACELPVVGSDIQGVREVIGDRENGLLIPAGNSKPISNAILRLLKDAELRRKLGRNGRSSVIKRYSWDAIVPQVEKVYYEAIADAN